jgi:hypothetical protein
MPPWRATAVKHTAITTAAQALASLKATCATSQAVTAMRKAAVVAVAVLASGLLAACGGQPSPDATVQLDQPTIECARVFSLHRGDPLVATIQVDWTSKCTVVLRHQ